jgi:hypothetical protein
MTFAFAKAKSIFLMLTIHTVNTHFVFRKTHHLIKVASHNSANKSKNKVIPLQA